MIGEPNFESVESFNSLQLKIEYLKNQVEIKQHDIDKLREAFSLNVNYFNDLVEKQKIILENLKNQTATLYSLESLVPLLINNSDISPKIKSNILNDKQKLKSMLLDLNLTKVEMNLTLNEYKELINTDVQFPKVIEFLPHLGGKDFINIQPKFKLTKSRFSPIVIGIPTIKREKASYLVETLKSLFDSMNDLEKNEALIVVMISEVIIYFIFINLSWNLF